MKKLYGFLLILIGCSIMVYPAGHLCIISPIQKMFDSSVTFWPIMKIILGLILAFISILFIENGAGKMDGRYL